MIGGSTTNPKSENGKKISIENVVNVENFLIHEKTMYNKQESSNNDSKSGTIIKTEILNSVETPKTQNDVLEASEAKDKKKDKKKKVTKKEDKKVKLLLDDGRIKDPKEQLSNIEQRAHQHTRKNVRRVINIDQNHDKCTKAQGEGNHLQKFTPCLTLISVTSVFFVILFAAFLYNDVIKKEIGIPVLCTSFIIFICTILVMCFLKNKEQKVESEMNGTSMQSLHSELSQIKTYN